MLRSTIATIVAASFVLAGCEGPAGNNGKAGEPGEPGAPGADADAEIVDEDTTFSGTKLISGIVYVAPDATLTIEAGTIVQMLPASGIFVEGTLLTQGTAASPVTFTALTSVGLAPFGLFVGGAGDASTLDHSVFEFVDLIVQREGTASLSNATFIDSGLEVRDRTTGFTLTDVDFSEVLGMTADCAFFLDVPSVTVTNSSFHGCDDGVYIAGSTDITATVSASTFDDLSSSAVQFFGADEYTNLLSVDDVVIDTTSSSAIDIRAANATVTNAIISNVDAIGIWADQDSTLTVSLTEITDIANNCIDSDADGLTVTHTTLTNCGDDALEGESGVTLTSVSVSGAEDDGIDILDGVISQCLVTGNADDGILIYGQLASSVSNCDVTDNGGYGVSGPVSPDNAVDLLDNNIAGNSLRGAYEIRLIEGNYIAANNGELGADTTVLGVLDGVRDSDTAQIWHADQITNPQSSWIAGNGP